MRHRTAGADEGEDESKGRMRFLNMEASVGVRFGRERQGGGFHGLVGE